MEFSSMTIVVAVAFLLMAILYVITLARLKTIQRQISLENRNDLVEISDRKDPASDLETVQEIGDVYYIEINDAENSEVTNAEGMTLETEDFEVNSFYFAALDLLCVIDASGFFKRLNNQWELNFGYQRKDLVDTELYTYLHKEDIKSVREFVESLEANSDTANFVCRFRTQSGIWKWLEWRLTRYGKWIYGAARDISERKNDEDTLRELVQVTVKTPSEGFFGVVCDWLRSWLSCDLCLIIEIDENRNGSIVAVASSEQLLFSTNLTSDDQLIGLTIEKGYCHYTDNIDVICPESLLVMEYAFRGYTGVCLYDKHKQIKGILCFLSQSEFYLPSMAQEVFQIIAVRASAEMEHLQAEDKYSSILNTAMDCFALVDTNGKIIDVNQAYCTLTGYSKRELLSMSIFEIDASDSDERMQLQMDRLINGGHNRFESRHRCKNGTLIDLEISINYLRSGSGKFVMFLRGISERKKTEAAFKDINERLTLATRAAQTGIWDWDVENNILVWNDEMFELYGKSTEKNATIEMWRASIHPVDREKVMVEVDLALKGIIEFNSEFRIIHPDETIKHVRVLSKVYRNEKDTAIRMIGMTWDITMERETQIELRNAIDAADRANRSKSEFIANMSHEIRTPLNAVIGFSELLETISQDNKQKQYINSIMTAGKSLLRIINDILDLSKIEAGMMKVQYEPMKLSPVFEEIQQIFNQRIEEKGLKLIFETPHDLPEILYLDEIRLRQVLLNIVGNSVKFTDSGSIRVEVTATNQIDSQPDTTEVEITITDTGIGIPLEEQSVIFEPFRQRSGQNTAKYGGTGLGLSISKKMTELMNGELSVVSEPGKGASFKLKLHNVKFLQTERKRSKKTGSENNPVYTFVKSTILVADDIESNRQMLKEHLVNAGLDVLEVENGESAVAMAIEKKPQLIFMDIRMPGMSGIDAMKKLREKSEFKDIPIIALSASNYLDEINKDEQYTFDEYIPKPVEVDTLMNVLLRHIPKVAKFDKVTKRPGKERLLLTPGLKMVYKNEFEQKIENFSGAIKMQRIRALIGELHLFSTEHASKEIDTLAIKLERAVEAYDIEKIKVLLKKCMDLCK